MFGFKIISEKDLLKMKRQTERMTDERNDTLDIAREQKSTIKTLREQILKITAEVETLARDRDDLADEICRLRRRLKKRKSEFYKHFDVCTPEHCDTCTHEQDMCRKYHLDRQTDVVCICPKPSFQCK